MEIRNYQRAALDAIQQHYRRGVHRQLVSMPTGTGKTVVFANVPGLGLTPGKMLVLAHREELIDQAADKIAQWNPALKVTVEMAERHAEPNADIVVASVPTLGRAGKRADSFPWNQFTTCVVDEAHHATASTYRRIFERGGFLAGDKLLLGVTATPERSDGIGLEEIFQDITFDYRLLNAIKDGWLVNLRAQTVKSTTQLDRVHTLAGDFNQGELAAEVNTPERNALVVSGWMDFAPERKTLCFCVDIEHAQDLALAFQQHGVSAEAVWGDDPLRAEKLCQLREGWTQVLTNCNVLTEGYDDPSIECILLARPTKSGLLYRQMVGRGTRLNEGKADCLVLDIVDVTKRHRLCTAATLAGLPADMCLDMDETLTGTVQRIEEEKDRSARALREVFSETVNLFEMEIPPEVNEHITLNWTRTGETRYVLILPGRDAAGGIARLVVEINALGQAAITGLVNETRPTLEGGMRRAEEIAKLLLKRAGQPTSWLAKDAKWHGNPATQKQRELLRELYKKDPPPTLTSGEASKAIAAYFARKGERVLTQAKA